METRARGVEGPVRHATIKHGEFSSYVDSMLHGRSRGIGRAPSRNFAGPEAASHIYVQFYHRAPAAVGLRGPPFGVVSL